MGRSLYNGSDEATEETNTTGLMDGILSFDPTEGRKLVFAAITRGGKTGIPIYWDPKQGAATDLPLDTELALQYREAGEDDWQTVSEPVDNIQPWRDRSVADQQDEEVVGSVVVPIKGAEVHVRDVDEFRVAINSSAAMSWSDSAGLFFEEDAVRETAIGT